MFCQTVLSLSLLSVFFADKEKEIYSFALLLYLGVSSLFLL